MYEKVNKAANEFEKEITQQFFLKNISGWDEGLHGGVVVSTVASQREGSRFNPHLGPFCVEFACSPRVCVGSLRVLRLPPTVQNHAC